MRIEDRIRDVLRQDAEAVPEVEGWSEIVARIGRQPCVLGQAARRPSTDLDLGELYRGADQRRRGQRGPRFVVAGAAALLLLAGGVWVSATRSLEGPSAVSTGSAPPTTQEAAEPQSNASFGHPVARPTFLPPGFSAADEYWEPGDPKRRTFARYHLTYRRGEVRASDAAIIYVTTVAYDKYKARSDSAGPNHEIINLRDRLASVYQSEPEDPVRGITEIMWSEAGVMVQVVGRGMSASPVTKDDLINVARRVQLGR